MGGDVLIDGVGIGIDWQIGSNWAMLRRVGLG